MEQEVVVSRLRDVKSAVDELCGKLRKSSRPNAVLFMAAITYDFAALSAEIKSRFPDSEVIGASTAGEISPEGFLEGSVVLTTMSDPSTRVRAVLVENGSKYPAASADAVRSALTSCGIRCGDRNSHKDAFAITFINGVYNAEETILTTFYSIIQNDAFQLAGGTAGYTGSEAKTFVSVNGKSTQDGAAFLFVKTPRPFDIRQEDIFKPTGKSMSVTAADPVGRIIKTLDGRSARSVYAEKLGVDERRAESMTFENPFGRYLDGELHIAALAGFPGHGEISLFARVVPNSTLELMHISDPLKNCDETCAGIRSAIPNPRFALLLTCITRTLFFEREKISGQIIRKYNDAFPVFCGFSCYGEQKNRIHCNQTLVTVVIGG